ncbi:hypothetical protein [uncultured Secundilactobacillus sp.]|uniref:hypothetical protein n=1 Tax=uncultured Secundilactobacillus sp. TaxID=2813935 RepID=UPI00258C576C|nr:hypothetical protein [uncultured Secundilactobacillus sp.]
MEIISLPLQLDRYIKQRYRDGTSMGYVVNRNPFELNQYGVHLDLLDKKGKVYQKIEVYFDQDQRLSQPFEANGRRYRLMLTEEPPKPN